MKGSDSTRKIANSLVALSSAAVVAVYTAGYLRTRSAASRFELEAAVRRAVNPPVATDAEAHQSADAKVLESRVAPAVPVQPRTRPSPKRVARAAPAPVPSEASEPAPVYNDGTYVGWGTSRHGDIQAAVVIEGGRIASATIAQCLTRYSCSVIAALPPQVASRQSPNVDYVSGATQSANAFYYAVVEALSKAK